MGDFLSPEGGLWFVAIETLRAHSQRTEKSFKKHEDTGWKVKIERFASLFLIGLWQFILLSNRFGDVQEGMKIFGFAFKFESEVLVKILQPMDDVDILTFLDWGVEKCVEVFNLSPRSLYCLMNHWLIFEIMITLKRKHLKTFSALTPFPCFLISLKELIKLHFIFNFTFPVWVIFHCELNNVMKF